MSREVHVRVCESPRGRFPWATRRNIYVRSCRAGERVMASVTRFLTKKLRLKVKRGQERGRATGGAQVLGLQHRERWE
jgi:RNA-directed DNA polymerase